MSIVTTAGDLVDDLLGARPGIELEELDSIAALQTRRDRKYVIAAARLPTVLDGITRPIRVLDIDGRRTFGYRSTYLDTADLLSYHDATRSRPKRFKVRTRRYLATDTSWLEVKARTGRGLTVKERVELVDGLDARARAFVDAHDRVPVDSTALRPTMTTEYRRATIHCGQRATIDRELRCIDPDGVDVPLGALGDLLILETKSPSEAPGPIDRSLWRLGIRPTSISKYAVGIAAARPHLPANKWHRVLTRHVGRIRNGEPT